MNRVLSEVNLTLERGQKLGIVGGNGLGKSTFLKTMMGMIQPLGGRVSVWHSCADWIFRSADGTLY